MKKLSFVTMVFVIFLFVSNGIQGQTTQTKLNQVELAKQFLGTWQANMGKDTLEMWEGKPYGKALVVSTYMVIKGVRSDSYLCSFGYDSRDDKLKGYNLFPNAIFMTWIGTFTTDKIIKIDGLDCFNPGIILWKSEFEFKSPEEVIIRNFTPEGIKSGEWTFKRIKK
jgi:hypothetical protein